MTAHLTAAQARQLGLFDNPNNAARKVRRERFPYRTRCVRCGEVFTTEASETRHLTATGHPRYELEVTP